MGWCEKNRRCRGEPGPDRGARLWYLRYSRNGCAVPRRRPHHLGKTRGAWLFLAIIVFCNPLIDALLIYPFDNQVAGSLFFFGVILALGTYGIPVIL